MLRKETLNLKDRWVLVTGASSGLGLEIARQLALEHQAHVILCGRREDRLLRLQTELKADGAGGVEIVAADLATESGCQAVIAAMHDPEHRVYAAILNAGVTYFGPDLEQDPDDFQNLIDTNVRSTVMLSRAFAREQRRAGERGALMLVSSLGGLSPLPYQSAYSGSKAFVTNYGLALGHELRPDRISVTVFSPGGIATELLEKSGLARKFRAGDFGIMDAKRCARAALTALIERRAHAIPGPLNRLTALVMKLAPEELTIAQTAALYRDAVSSTATTSERGGANKSANS